MARVPPSARVMNRAHALVIGHAPIPSEKGRCLALDLGQVVGGLMTGEPDGRLRCWPNGLVMRLCRDLPGGSPQKTMTASELAHARRLSTVLWRGHFVFSA